MQDRRVGFYRFLGRHWIETGSLRPMSEEELGDLVMAIWLVGDTWLAYLEAMGRGSDADQVHRGAQLIYSLMKPHLTESAAEAFARSGWGLLTELPESSGNLAGEGAGA